ncbi:MAG TPA: malate synthase A, partial [Thermoplasmata archaeon]
HCIGGMAAQIPIRDDPQANEKAIAKVVADKEREVQEGHDGTWVAHPGLVSIARRVFDAGMPGPHQIHVKREDVRVTAADLLEVPKGPITEDGLRTNVNVALRYLQAWLGGMGCVPINHLMEDTATVEISRAQIWQWIRHGWQLDDGRTVTAGLFRVVLWEEVSKIERDLGGTLAEAKAIRKAAEILDDIVTDEEFVEFLTLKAYDSLERDSWGRPHVEPV